MLAGTAKRSGSARRWALLAIALPGCAVAALWLPGGAPANASAPTVYTFPIPGGKVAAPATQLTFRGVPASQLGTIQVTGSQSGDHTGTVAADSDGQGGSFIPDQPFTPGEVVTVSTGLNIAGATNGSYQFTVATPAPPVPPRGRPSAARRPGDVWRFRSRPDLAPAAIHVLKRSAHTWPGDIFIAAQFGPIQDGPTLLDSSGNLIWFKHVPSLDWVTDFREQRYQGNPVLTWWQGYVTAGAGVGQGVIDDSTYKQIALVSAGNGLHADLHEFDITRWNTALVTAYYPVYWDTSSIGGPKQQVVMDSVVQEIDIPTGLVLFQWDSLDHVPLSDSYVSLPTQSNQWFEYAHVNSIEPDYDGNLIISLRNTFSAFKVDHQSAATIWILGGKRSSFTMGPGAQFAFQHDVRVHAPFDRWMTVFDDGAGVFNVHRQSRGLKLKLDFSHMTATAVTQLQHSPGLLASFMGNVEQLPNLDNFVGWGQQPFLSEFDVNGNELFDARFIGPNSSYRAWRLNWTGTPHTRPAVATQNSGRSTAVWVSWNGATGVASWRVLGGSRRWSLRGVGGAARNGFETRISVGAQKYIAVQALDGNGHVMATSKTVATH